MLENARREDPWELITRPTLLPNPVSLNIKNIEIYGPADAKISKIRNKYRIRILLKVEKKIAIQSLISQIIEQRKCPSFINVKIDVDPLTFT